MLISYGSSRVDFIVNSKSSFKCILHTFPGYGLREVWQLFLVPVSFFYSNLVLKKVCRVKF